MKYTLLTLLAIAAAAAMVGCGGSGGGTTGGGGGGGGGVATALAPQYRLVALPVLSGGENTAVAINNAGQVVGTSGPAGAERAYYWDATNGLVSLHSAANPAGATSQALDLNGVGEAVGTLTIGARTRGFFALQSGGGFIDPDAGGTLINRANAMNDTRVIVGSSGDTEDSLRAVRFTSGSGLSLLPDVPDSTMSEALDINARGDICGWAFVDGKEAGIFWPAGGNAQRWVGNGLNNPITRFYSVNSEGVAVGQMDRDATILVPGQNRENLGALIVNQTPRPVAALGISDGRLVAGYASVNGQDVALAWGRDRTPVDLNPRLDSSGQGWVLNRAIGISNDGKICGVGTFNGAARAFVLIPK